MNAAHNLTGREYPVAAAEDPASGQRLHIGSNGRETRPNERQNRGSSGLNASAAPQVLWVGTAHVRVRSYAAAASFEAEAAKLDAAIAANLKGLGYGG